MKTFAKQIYDAVRTGKLAEPFDSTMVKKACRGWAENTYKNFLPKHRENNPTGATVLFKRVGSGLYKTIPKLHQDF